MPQKHQEAIIEQFSLFTENHFKFLESMLEQQKENSVECLPYFKDLFFPKMTNPWSSLTIFDPNIVSDTLHKANEHFNFLLETSPQEIQKIALDHFEEQQKLSVQIFSQILGNPVDPIVEAPKNDRRFQNPLWNSNPYFSYLQQSYLLFVDLIKKLAKNLDGLDYHTKMKMHFYMRQLIDALSPSNFLLTNPDVLDETLKTQGENLKKGYLNFLKDCDKGHITMTDMNAYTLGKDLATTEGNVIFENEVLQLLWYKPRQKKVYSHPILIIPAWINKYYIFDLRAENSFVRWLLDQGFQVFVVSWINPVSKSEKRHSFSDYVLKGALEAVQATVKYSKSNKINAVGYCAGGILLSCLASYLESHHNKPFEESPFSSLSVLATPIDTRKGGEILAYICDQQLKLLEESLDDLGIIPAQQLLTSFNLLRPNELLWSFYVNHYLLGKDAQAFDMLFWNCDAMNLPHKMHTKYLRHIFLDNKLIEKGGLRVDHTPIDLHHIKAPLFALGTIRDHIVPWQSVFPLLNHVSSEIKEFVLAGSGHVAGVINHPELHKYNYWAKSFNNDPFAEQWLESAEEFQGSWWKHWSNWVAPFSGDLKKAFYCDQSEIIEKAPGRFALVKTKKQAT
jgi:polyhydroxyalkanoate synthase